MIARRLVVLAVLGLLLARGADAKVAATDLASLAASADVIAVVKVAKIHTKQGAKIAQASVSLALKGFSGVGPLYFVASPTWTCDISTATKGEEALVFLRKIEDRSSVNGKRFGYGWELPEKGYEPLYAIAHAGRGRMPIRTLDETKYAEVWVGDVALPETLKTHPGREPKYTFIRDVALDEMLNELKTMVRSQPGRGGPGAE